MHRGKTFIFLNDPIFVIPSLLYTANHSMLHPSFDGHSDNSNITVYIYHFKKVVYSGNSPILISPPQDANFLAVLNFQIPFSVLELLVCISACSHPTKVVDQKLGRSRRVLGRERKLQRSRSLGPGRRGRRRPEVPWFK